jgi:hypothetical protein
MPGERISKSVYSEVFYMIQFTDLEIRSSYLQLSNVSNQRIWKSVHPTEKML